ncbi:hypothetical protein [Bosea sp. (in: a-proteobacteria)]|uniref:hypothetical protein n=1 Tax=Bosea sp. (in: a-proteobacteria) TaxID=1871050 RepID=UPI0027366014|nr:hypothetical protein [Bosea sp. (in: a-proteobacteria)]MDP3255335.1 hypothetical protein [Bosea sp. (in: a-proteobacteria)]
MFEFEGFERRRLAIGLLAVALTLPFGAARAQAPATPAPLPIPAPAPTPTIGGTVDPMPVQPGPAPSARQAALRVAAQFAGDRKPIRSGLVWRVLSESADGSPPRIVARSSEPEPAFTLDPGTYLLHAAYGFASGTKRVTLGPLGLREQVAISAGGLSLAGSIGDAPIPPAQLGFQIFVPLQGNSEGRLVTNARGGELIRLPEGTYHIVSTYGDSNAIQRADVKVESGKITDATLHHRAARVTLKLVAAAGGEAFAGTAFSVLTPGGDVIREAIGAFPQVILAEGDYVLIARQEGQVFSRDFKVESGLDRDIEVLAR